MSYNFFDKNFVSSQLCIKLYGAKYIVGYFKILVCDYNNSIITNREIVIHTIEEVGCFYKFTFTPQDDDPLIDKLYDIICEAESNNIYYIRGDDNENLQPEVQTHKI